MKTNKQILIDELKRQTGCTDEDIQGLLETGGSKPVVNRRMGEALRDRFATEDLVDQLAELIEDVGLATCPWCSVPHFGRSLQVIQHDTHCKAAPYMNWMTK